MWIEDYRTANGMELDEFARAVNKYGHTEATPTLICTITDTLVHLLEIGSITHPRIANVIAEFCGASAEQRDMIVHKDHHGEWQPNQPVALANPCAVRFNNSQSGAKPVVKINISGNVVAAYESVVEAARHEDVNEHNIRSRCKRRAKHELTVDHPYTFRYQAEWIAMSREEQLKDIYADGEIVGV